jgi:alkanesulfonate monooxygenase SsuD/methylene tetrahydromethanopterin reductase-like flavin-dependent oxidoreductase (luciferase family)
MNIQVIKKIMTDDVVEFKGEFYNIPASKIGPKPLQKPHPPTTWEHLVQKHSEELQNMQMDG